MDAHVKERFNAVLSAVVGELEHRDGRFQQQVGHLLQVGRDYNADVLAEYVIVDPGQFRHLQHFFGLLYGVSSLPELHARPDEADLQSISCGVMNVNFVVRLVVVHLKLLHCIALGVYLPVRDRLDTLDNDQVFLFVVVFIILVIDSCDLLIVVTIKHILENDVDYVQGNSGA